MQLHVSKKEVLFLYRFLAILKKEWIQMRRDGMTLAIMVMLPIVQLLLFGFAIHTDVKHQPTVVFDQSLTEESRDLLASFTASEYFDIQYTARSFDEVNGFIDQGKAKVGIIIPPDLTESLRHERTTPIQVIVDASDSMSSSSAIGAAQSIGQLASKEFLLSRHPELSPEKLSLYDMRVRAWYNRDAVSVYYMLPGILGIILTLTMVMITSMAIVRERERGTLEQLLVTPMRIWELLLGKIVPYIFVGYVQTTVAILVGLAIFEIPLRGSIPLLYGLTTLFITATLTLGILISTVAKTQMQAMMMSLFTFLPSILLSGFIFPIQAMPTLFQYVSAVIPMTYYMDITRGIFLKGNGLSELYPQALSLFLFILLVFGAAIKKFSKTMN